MKVHPFIEAEKQNGHNVKRACELLKVSRTAFYASRSAKPGPRAVRDAELTQQITAVHERSRGTCGAPRVHAVLKQEGAECGRRRVARLMRAAGLQGRMGPAILLVPEVLLIELSTVINQLRGELSTAIATGTNEGLRFELGPIELEVTLALSQEAGGNAKVRFWVLDAGAQGKEGSVATQRIKLTLQPKLDGSAGSAFVSDEAKTEKPEPHQSGGLRTPARGDARSALATTIYLPIVIWYGSPIGHHAGHVRSGVIAPRTQTPIPRQSET
ncbi:trypco2 family protein [Actinomadura sp. 6N118]|uniref:trypco2 family protein n=1 Tax=Actinomadura sp. 6N118 TaxID=3375151 RepID=UPI0037B44883